MNGAQGVSRETGAGGGYGDAPYVQVLTRCNQRPHALMRNVRSLAAQTDGDWAQTLLVDTASVGVGPSHVRLAEEPVRGEWVWCLDDDDECVLPTLVEGLKRIATTKPGVGVVMVRMDHGPELGVLPGPETWGRGVAEGAQGISSFIVRRAVWLEHRAAWGSLRYASDFDFIASVMKGGPEVYWWDVTASRTQAGRHIGATELEFAVLGPGERAVTR